MYKLLIGLAFLLFASVLAGIASAMQRMGRDRVEALAKKISPLSAFFFQKSGSERLLFSLNLSRGTYLIAYALFGANATFSLAQEIPLSLSITGLFVAYFLSELLMRSLSLYRSQAYFKLFCPLSTLFLAPLFPFSYLLYLLLQVPKRKGAAFSRMELKEKMQEVLQESEFSPYLSDEDRKLLLSVASFKERIAREVMVPRIDMHTLSAETPVKQAAQDFLEQGYSRVPIWKENVDNVIGTLYYKDLLSLYFTLSPGEKELDSPVEKLLKPIVYSPETKKISNLLQEFRSKQIHMAIVVDEYGGTEGIVTIEDILEELVGEIADEYDTQEEALFHPLPSGGWIVDAKMNISDIEDELGIKIPTQPDYDTLGGYIFDKAGTIPKKGWRIHHDDFDLEVLSSSERAIEKVKITT